jgi:hypothetical protein
VGPISRRVVTCSSSGDAEEHKLEVGESGLKSGESSSSVSGRRVQEVEAGRNGPNRRVGASFSARRRRARWEK